MVGLRKTQDVDFYFFIVYYKGVGRILVEELQDKSLPRRREFKPSCIILLTEASAL